MMEVNGVVLCKVDRQHPVEILPHVVNPHMYKYITHRSIISAFGLFVDACAVVGNARLRFGFCASQSLLDFELCL